MTGNRRWGTLLIFLLLVSMVMGCSAEYAGKTAGAVNEADQSSEMADDDLNMTTDQSYIPRYEQYSYRFRNEPRPSIVKQITAQSFTGTDGMNVTVLDSFEGASGPVVRTEETGSIHWDVEVPEDGMYQIGIRYFPVEGNGSPIERELLIDGESPFDEARQLVFTRVWRNALSVVERDKNDNDLRPRQIQHPEWQEILLKDSEGFNEEPFLFHLTKGAHRITLTSLREPMIIDYLQLLQDEKTPLYQDVLIMYESSGYKPTRDIFVKVQGEDAIRKSNPSLFPLNDRSSPGTEPYHVSKIRMNTIGGVNWKVPGQWITWEFDIPETGLYEFGMRFKQNLVRGGNVARKMYIDDKEPFQEAGAIPYAYDGAWQMKVTGHDAEPYLYYLTKGKHRIKMEVTMGDLADVIRTVRSSIQQLNALYLKIITITGTVPDPFRDYQLEDSIPDMAKVFLHQSALLNKAAERMDKIVEGTSGSTTILRTTAYQLEDIGKHPETITSRLTKFKDNVSSLGTWILSVSEQPLEIDYLFFKSPNIAEPKANPGFISKLKHEIGSFWYSFSEDYNSVGSSGDKNNAITVWINSGRDQAQLLRSMINSSFTAKTGLEVDLQLVDPAVVLPATLAGKGPDIAVSMPDVINFAMRNALQDLSQFQDFPEVQSRFMNSAFAGFTFRGGTYAIPETQSFPMLFYRKDIFDQLKLKVPDTWDELYHLLPELQKQNMQLAMPNVPVFEMLLYQNGGRYFEGDGIAAALDSKAGMESFRKWSELYTNYKLPVEFDFINRFRTGDMPIGIANYTTYNFLTIFAPEIRGQWDFTVLPGTRGPDGKVHREAISTATGVVMFKSAANKQAAWNFIKWWTDTDAQVTFGREMEAILGESARYAAANLEALKQLPWAAKDYNSLMEQLRWVVGKPEVPGGYMMDRHLLNAFYEVYKNAAEPRETLENYVRIVNEELTIKRKEFGLPTR